MADLTNCSGRRWRTQDRKSATSTSRRRPALGADPLGGETTQLRPERDDLPAYARRKAAPVRAVLDACG